jgi:hypothetical protein
MTPEERAKEIKFDGEDCLCFLGETCEVHACIASAIKAAVEASTAISSQ